MSHHNYDGDDHHDCHNHIGNHYYDIDDRYGYDDDNDDYWYIQSFHLLRQDGPGVISDSVDVPEMARTMLTRMMVVWLMPVVLNKKKLYSNFYHNSSVVYNITTALTIKLFLLLF